jgi:hypothetical protein
LSTLSLNRGTSHTTIEKFTGDDGDFIIKGDLGPSGPLITRHGTILAGGRFNNSLSNSNVGNPGGTAGYHPDISPTDRSKIQELLNEVGKWNWRIFDFEGIAPKPLYTLGLYVFHKAGLMGRFNLPLDKLRHFLLRIEAGYHSDVPYHNATHACDVLHATNFFINTDAVKGKISDIETLSAYVSAIIHGMFASFQ